MTLIRGVSSSTHNLGLQPESELVLLSEFFETFRKGRWNRRRSKICPRTLGFGVDGYPPTNRKRRRSNVTKRSCREMMSAVTSMPGCNA